VTAGVIQFPKPRKRGPKVRTGPCAEVVPFPSLHRADFWKRWMWLKRFGDDWAVDQPGDVDEAVPSCSREGERAKRLGSVFAKMARSELPDLEARLRKRSYVKDWLESLGVDMARVRNAEDALFYAFDRLSGPTPPSAA
jgi:hypothetical protein